MENNTKVLTIKDIESMDEGTTFIFADEKMEIKGHTVYFIDLGGYFGFSALVFADGQQIKYANDYELHHRGKSRAELRELYIKKMNASLFTDEELRTVTGYEDKAAKEYYIRNYYGLRRPHVSAFYMGKNPPSTEGLTFSPVFMAYYADVDFVKKGAELLRGLEAAEKRNAESLEYWKGAFLYEMYNHEYGINWQADFDVCSCFGSCAGVKDYENREKLFDACGFSEIQRTAYKCAMQEYYKSEAANL